MRTKAIITSILFSFQFIQIVGQDTIWTELGLKDFNKILEVAYKEVYIEQGAFTYSISSFNSSYENLLIEKAVGIYFHTGNKRFSSFLDVEQLEDDSCTLVKLKSEDELYIRTKDSFSNLIPEATLAKETESKLTIAKGIIQEITIYHLKSISDNISFNCWYTFNKSGRLNSLKCHSKTSISVSNSNQNDADTVSILLERIDEIELNRQLKLLGYDKLTTEEFLRGTDNFKVFDLRP